MSSQHFSPYNKYQGLGMNTGRRILRKAKIGRKSPKVWNRRTIVNSSFEESGLSRMKNSEIGQKEKVQIPLIIRTIHRYALKKQPADLFTLKKYCFRQLN
jgi:hypothetical protein